MSQAIAKSRQNSFIPPYCPNPNCSNHRNPVAEFFRRKGKILVKKYPGYNKRFQCKTCGRYFVFSAFALDYRCRSNSFEKIFWSSTQGMSNRSIARMLGFSEHKVRQSLKLLARQALLRWELLAKNLTVREPLAYDGFETFIRSQYDINNINHLVGKKSLFVYDFNYSHLNRKGKMTELQREKLKQIEEKFGRYPTDRVRIQTKNIFQRILKTNNTPLILHTDEHKTYQLVLGNDLGKHGILHQVTNSKKCRNGKNPLFPVNHLDMKIRHFLKSCTRETIAFNKNEAGLMDRMILFLASKNFMRGKFIKGKIGDNEKSPAMIVGITKKIFSFKEFFFGRMTAFQVHIRECWREFYYRKFVFARYEMAAYSGC